MIKQEMVLDKQTGIYFFEVTGLFLYKRALTFKEVDKLQNILDNFKEDLKY